jgi:hypothetical protein
VSKLPNADHASIGRQKIVSYLLSRTHPVGRCKAEFLHGLGFSHSHPELLETELRRLVAEAEVRSTESTAFGTKYILEGLLTGPTANAQITVVCIVETGSENPRLATVCPADTRL